MAWVWLKDLDAREAFPLSMGVKASKVMWQA